MEPLSCQLTNHGPKLAINVQEAIWLDARKPKKRFEFLRQAITGQINTVDLAVALVRIKGAVDNLLKHLSRPLDCICLSSSDPCLSVVNHRRSGRVGLATRVAIAASRVAVNRAVYGDIGQNRSSIPPGTVVDGNPTYREIAVQLRTQALVL